MKRRRYRQHINPLSLPALVPRDPIAVPAGTTRVEVELGCGDAEFLIGLSDQHQNTFFVGLDIREAFLARGHKQIQARGLSNIRLEPANFLVDMPHLFSPNTVGRFYINFPDPWFKRRTHNRRWLDAASTEALVAALEPEGEIFYQSDVWHPTLAALSLFEANDQLLNLCGGWSFCRHNPFPAQSGRERSCIDQRHKIWRLYFKKRS